jgi:hypothetical protein
MTFRLLLAFALSFVPLASRAADCATVKDDYDEWGRRGAYVSIIGEDCGSLKVISRRRDDPRHDTKVDIFASYAVFDPPKSMGERRYNGWVSGRAAKMNFDKPIDLSDGNNVADTMAGFVYRSTRLLSASIGGWICCGAHGFSWSMSLNIDPATGNDVKIDDLIDTRAALNVCWERFSKLDGPLPDQGKLFSEQYPRAGFVNTRMTNNWTVSDAGLSLDFGYLLAYIGAEFSCLIAAEELRPFLRPGISLPL